GRRLERFRLLADRIAPAEAVAADPLHLAQLFRLDQVADLRLHGVGALLRAALADAVVLARRLDDLAPFPDVVGDGLLDVDVLTRLERPDRRQGVPVVTGGDHDGVD